MEAMEWSVCSILMGRYFSTSGTVGMAEENET